MGFYKLLGMVKIVRKIAAFLGGEMYSGNYFVVTIRTAILMNRLLGHGNKLIISNIEI